VTPISISPVVGGSNPAARSTPEPAVDKVGLEIGSVAAVKVALSSRSPDVPDPSASNALLDEIVFSRSLNGNSVHAMASANVPSVEPVNLQVSRWTVLP